MDRYERESRGRFDEGLSGGEMALFIDKDIVVAADPDRISRSDVSFPICGDC